MPIVAGYGQQVYLMVVFDSIRPGIAVVHYRTQNPGSAVNHLGNRLLEIEQELGSEAKFAGKNYAINNL